MLSIRPACGQMQLPQQAPPASTGGMFSIERQQALHSKQPGSGSFRANSPGYHLAPLPGNLTLTTYNVTQCPEESASCDGFVSYVCILDIAVATK